MTRIANRRLWRTADGRVVEDGDPAAAVLIAAVPGDEIDEATLADLEIPAKFLDKGGDKPTVEDKPAETEPEAVPAVEVPAAPAVETKPARTTRKPAAKRTAKRT